MASEAFPWDDGMRAVSGKEALHIVGGAYCNKYAVSSTHMCGGALLGKGSCPYLNAYTTTLGTDLGTTCTTTCANCGVTCCNGELLSPGCN